MTASPDTELLVMRQPLSETIGLHAMMRITDRRFLRIRSFSATGLQARSSLRLRQRASREFGNFDFSEEREAVLESTPSIESDNARDSTAASDWLESHSLVSSPFSKPHLIHPWLRTSSFVCRVVRRCLSEPLS